MGKVLISAKDIGQEFKVGDEVIAPLKHAAFDVTENSFNIIYGPSGSGKSTLLNILTGLQRPSRGEIQLNGKDLYALKPDELAYFRANQIGIVYQTNYWVKSLNVLENVSMPMYFLGYSRSKAAKIAMSALERVGMQEYAKKFPILLSGGEQQRVAMARALVNNPLLVIADEPTGSLDSKNGDMIMGILQSCQTDFKCTVILVTHNMEYLPMADNLLHIQDGEVTVMDVSSMRSTTDGMIEEMRGRIEKLIQEKKGRVLKEKELYDSVHR